MKNTILSNLIYLLSSAIGIIAFLYPFLIPVIQSPSALTGQAHTYDSPMLLSAIVGLSFIALLFEVQGQAVGAKFIALLGVLVAMNAIVRFLEVILPVPGGFSPTFFLIVVAGYVYGGRFGFQMGVLTLLVSALITGGVGPWLPYQMLTAGWVGLTTPLCLPLARAFPYLLPDIPPAYGEIAILSLFSAVWGFLYGAIMNIWFWPLMSGPTDQYWTMGIGFVETIQRYAVFYLVTSLGWDSLRAFGNIAMMVVLGIPTLRVLRRFKQRFDFHYEEG